MRNTALAMILFLAASVSLSAGESMRLNFVKGLYSVNVPANWYIDVDAGDSTLSIAQGPDAASPRVIIAVPNPTMAASLGDYATLAANSFINALGGGQIVENKDNKEGHGVIFRSSASGTNFIGAIQTLRHGNYAILTIFLTRESDYERTKDWAAIVLDSLRINDGALEQETAFVSGQAANLVKDFQRFQTTSRAPTTSGTTTPNRAPANDPGSLWGTILGGGSAGGSSTGGRQDPDVAGSLGSILNSILGGDDSDPRPDQGRATPTRTTPRGSVPNTDTSGYGDLLNNPFSGLTR